MKEFAEENTRLRLVNVSMLELLHKINAHGVGSGQVIPSYIPSGTGVPDIYSPAAAADAIKYDAEHHPLSSENIPPASVDIPVLGMPFLNDVPHSELSTIQISDGGIDSDIERMSSPKVSDDEAAPKRNETVADDISLTPTKSKKIKNATNSNTVNISIRSKNDHKSKMRRSKKRKRNENELMFLQRLHIFCAFSGRFAVDSCSDSEDLNLLDTIYVPDHRRNDD